MDDAKSRSARTGVYIFVHEDTKASAMTKSGAKSGRPFPTITENTAYDSYGNMQSAGNAGLPLEPNLPQRTSDVANVRLLDVRQADGCDQLGDPHEPRPDVRRRATGR